MEDAPQWVDAILDVLEGCLEGHSPGSFELRFIPEECQLIIARAVAEIVGGAEDGEEVFAFFSLQLAALAQAFDGLREMSWNTMQDELHVEGTIDGEDAWITVQKFPFQDDQKPRWVVAGESFAGGTTVNERASAADVPITRSMFGSIARRREDGLDNQDLVAAAANAQVGQLVCPFAIWSCSASVIPADQIPR